MTPRRHALIVALLMALWIAVPAAGPQAGAELERQAAEIDTKLMATCCFAQQVTVLHLGKVFAQGSIDEIVANEDVAAIYLGQTTAHETAHETAHATTGAPHA